MAKIAFKGFEVYANKILALGESTPGIVKPANYKGAAIVHKAIVEELQALPTDEVWRNNDMRYPAPLGIKQEQKEGLINSIGFSKMENKNGFINLRIGFDGYNNLITERFPQGEPNAFVARELVLGTSRLQRNDFVKRAVRKSKAEATEAMRKEAEARINKIMKG